MNSVVYGKRLAVGDTKRKSWLFLVTGDWPLITVFTDTADGLFFVHCPLVGLCIVNYSHYKRPNGQSGKSRELHKSQFRQCKLPIPHTYHLILKTYLLSLSNKTCTQRTKNSISPLMTTQKQSAAESTTPGQPRKSSIHGTKIPDAETCEVSQLYTRIITY